MKTFSCPSCASLVFFENVSCLDCGLELAYAPDLNAMVSRDLSADGTARDCENRKWGMCNWNLGGSSSEKYCLACSLNRTIPNLSDRAAFEGWRELEKAKHRAIYGLLRLGLPVVSKHQDSTNGLLFDFLGARTVSDPPVVTGHLEGVVTIDVAEADPVSRETRRIRLGEPYRTLVGHFRHEMAHYYWEQLVRANPDSLSAFRQMFGDERTDYGQALQLYHAEGPRPGWETTFVTAYSCAHPWEDWAETCAHYLHLVDLLDTAHEFRVMINPSDEPVPPISARIDFDPYQHDDFEEILEASLGLTLALNSLNRSVGQPDLYPFAIPLPAKEKLEFVHSILRRGSVSTS